MIPELLLNHRQDAYAKFSTAVPILIRNNTMTEDAAAGPEIQVLLVETVRQVLDNSGTYPGIRSLVTTNSHRE